MGNEVHVINAEPYPVREFGLSGLEGISDKTLEMHFKLYAGYVKNTNLLNEQLAGLAAKSEQTPGEKAMFAELKRRLGFEYNGMVLHEYYFENMTKKGGGEPGASSPFLTAVEQSFGDFGTWKKDFSAVGGLRGVGWVITYRDPSTGRLHNQWVSDHENGHISGFAPILVMDVWEHAFLLDYAPAQKGKYIEAFLANVDWAKTDERMNGARGAK